MINRLTAKKRRAQVLRESLDISSCERETRKREPRYIGEGKKKQVSEKGHPTIFQWLGNAPRAIRLKVTK